MYRYPSNKRRLEPLPESFENALSALDERLAESARADRDPSGLADDVFEATVRLLPETVEVTTISDRLRFVRPTRIPWHRTRLARLALAACVALACTASILTWQSPTIDPEPTRVAGTAVPYIAPVHFHDVAYDLEQIPRDSTSHIESDIAYLLDTNEVNSLEDVTAELAFLVAAMEL